MGQVHLAEPVCLVEEELCDLLLHRALHQAQDTTLGRFEREAQATATLESLHTVRVYDFGRTDAGEFYYAMELLNGFDRYREVARSFGSIDELEQ